MTDAELGKWLREKRPIFFLEPHLNLTNVQKAVDAADALLALLRDVADAIPGTQKYVTVMARLRVVLGEGR